MNIVHSWLFGREYAFIIIPVLAIGIVLLAVKLNRPPDHPDLNVVAAYREGLITKEQVVDHFRMASAQDQLALRSVEGAKHVIQDLAVHAVMEKWATERQVDTKETFRSAMKDAADAVTLHDVAQRVHELDVQVEESEIQKYYDEHRDQFQDQSLTQAKDQIRNILHAQKEQVVVDEFIKQLRANATVTMNADLLMAPPPSDSELQSYYQSHLDDYREPDRLRVDEIRVKAKDKADRALARIQAGEDFSQVAFETNDPTFVSNANWIARGTRGTAFDSIAFVLGEGEVSKVFQEGDMYAIVRVAQKSAGRLKSLEEVHEIIAARLRAEGEQAFAAANKDEVLLSVNGIRYTLGDFLGEYIALPADIRAHHSSPQDKKQLVDAIADRLLILQSVPARMAQSQNQKEMEETRRHVLAEILHEEEMEGKLEVTDQEIEEHYRQNPQHYAISPKAKISYIRVGAGVDDTSRKSARDKIQTAYGRVRPAVPWQSGEDFAMVAREFSEDQQTAQKGGDLDSWIEIPPNALLDLETLHFFETVLALNQGDISPVFAAGDSYYIVRVREKVEGQPQPLDKVRDLVRSDMQDVKHQKALEQFEQELVQRMDLKIHDDRLNQVVQELGQP